MWPDEHDPVGEIALEMEENPKIATFAYYRKNGLSFPKS